MISATSTKRHGAIHRRTVRRHRRAPWLDTRGGDREVAAMLAPDALERLAAILADDFQIPRERVEPGAHLRTDLGLDSLSLTDLAFLVQRDFGFKADADDFRGVTTVGALADFCAARATVTPANPDAR